MGGVRLRAGHEPCAGSDNTKTVAHSSPRSVHNALTFPTHLLGKGGIGKVGFFRALAAYKV